MVPLVSVVVPTHNRSLLLERCLTALAHQRMNAFEVVLVDDGSTDGTSKAVPLLQEQLALDLKYVHLPHSRGPACARNQGWRAARAELIAFTDDDCEPAPDWLQFLVQGLTSAPPNIAGIGGRIEPATTGLVSRYMSYHRILEPPPSLSYLVTANCIYRRSALEEVGGFNERVRTAGGEDPGLSFALSARGYRFGFAAQAVVRHNYREGLIDFARTFFRYGRGCNLVVDR